MKLNDIDVNYDFTTDTPKFWENFWDNRGGLGAGSADPDTKSKTMQQYHKLLYSRALPNGEIMYMQVDSCYLYWNGMWFGNDSITTTFRYWQYRYMLAKVAEYVGDYHLFVENYIHKLYSIGGEIIFPARKYSINQARGMHRKISDRFDLSLDCIRRFYNGESNPLSKCLENDRKFFDKFNDFKGYVDFFFLQDLVNENYDGIIYWLENNDFTINPLPQTVEDYMSFVNSELDFVSKRNQRISDFCNNQ